MLHQLTYDRASELFPVLSFNPEDNLFYIEPKSLGFGFVCNPFYGADDKTQDRLNSLLNQDWPPKTILQFCLWASPDMELQFKKILDEQGKELSNDLLKEVRPSRVQFLRQCAISGVDELVRLRDIKLIITARIPLKTTFPSQSDLEKIRNIQASAKQSLKTSGVDPVQMDAAMYIRIMQTILNWDNPSWLQEPSTPFDENELVREQLLDFSSRIVVEDDCIRLGEKVVKSLSPKRIPEMAFFGLARQFLIEPLSGSRGIWENVLITANIFFPDTDKERGKLEREKHWVTNQAYGPMLKFIPRLAKKKQSYDTLFEAMDKGDRLVKIYLGVTLFCDPDKVNNTVSNAQTFWREIGFQLLEDKYISLPIFLNSLPFGAEPEVIKELYRYRTMASRHCLTFLPVFGNWKGTGSPGLHFVGRDGQLMAVDIFDSSTNYNFVIAAESGSGKSFFTNEIILQYLSQGGRCWVIDVGRSYEKLTSLLDETFMVFDGKSDIRLNPFSIIKDYDDEADIITGLVGIMAAPTEKLSDFQNAGLRRVLNKVWQNEGNEMSVDSLSKALKSENDTRLRDIGEQLYPFTSKGEYGRFFTGKNNVNFQGNLVVIELEELKAKQHLQQVVLLQMIYQIQQDMYLGIRDRRKLVIIDEAWDLLTKGDVGKFIEHGYRRFRKYGGAAGIITQSLNDLYNSPGGIAIAENSANKFLLGQTKEAIARLQKEKRLDIGEYGYALLKTVHTIPGQYSEVFFVTEAGIGVGRLYVEPYKKLLYSTKAEEIHAIQQLQKQGYSLMEAINILLEQKEKS